MRLHRLRHLGPTLVFAILAPAGAGAAKAVADLSAGATASGAATAVFSEQHQGLSPAVLTEATPMVELSRRDGSSPLFRRAPRVLRTRLVEAIPQRSTEPAAMRARDVERARLDFAAALAEAQAGLISARSTAPPLPYLSGSKPCRTEHSREGPNSARVPRATVRAGAMSIARPTPQPAVRERPWATALTGAPS